MKIYDIIQYEGPNNILAWKHPAEDFNTLSQLIVRMSQESLLLWIACNQAAECKIPNIAMA